MRADCIFCRVVAGGAEASFVHRDAVCSAFMDIEPVTPGHLLVIPNEHATGLADLPAEAGAHLFRLGQRLAAALKASGLPCEGIDLVLADGKVAGQTVFHVHLHVLPRTTGDGFGFRFPPAYPRHPTRTLLERDAAAIRAKMGSE